MDTEWQNPIGKLMTVSVTEIGIGTTLVRGAMR